MDLNELKSQSGLSGKKWDKSMKSLSKHSIIKVIVNNDNKIVELIQ